MPGNAREKKKELEGSREVGCESLIMHARSERRRRG